MELNDWMGEILTAGFSTLQTSLGVSGYKVDRIEDAIPKTAKIGAYVPLINVEDSILVGILATPETAQVMTRKFLHDEGRTTPFEDAEIRDSFKELANIFSGVLKRQLYDRAPILKTGLPICVEGDLNLSAAQHPACAHVLIDSLEVIMLVVRARSDFSKNYFQLPEQRDTAAQVSIQDWMGETLTAAFLLSHTALGVEKYKVKSVEHLINQPDLMGAYMPLIGTDDAVLIGILSTKQEFQSITRAFLGTTPADSELSAEDMADAIKEILNILVGLIKRQIFQHNPFLRTGFPIFVDGYIELAGDQESINALVEIEDAKTYVTVIRKKTPRLSAKPATV